MKRTKRIGKGLVLSAVVILLIGGIVYTVLSYSVSIELEKELERIRCSGKPVTLEELTPAPVPDEENAALIYKKAFAMIVTGTKEEKKLHNLKSVLFHLTIARDLKCRFRTCAILEHALDYLQRMLLLKPWMGA